MSKPDDAGWTCYKSPIGMFELRQLVGKPTDICKYCGIPYAEHRTMKEVYWPDTEDKASQAGMV